jgi:hypothetical protein
MENEMNSGANDRIIERFLNGEMGPSEERDFRRLLELDDDLRASLEAENLIRQTLRRESELLAEAPADSYTNFLALLATAGAVGAAAGGATAAKAATVAKSAAAAKAGGAMAGGAAAQGSATTAILAGTAVKAITAAVAVAAVGTGVYVASSGHGTKQTLKEPRAIERQVTITPAPMPQPAGQSMQLSPSDSLPEVAAAPSLQREGDSMASRPAGPTKAVASDARKTSPVLKGKALPAAPNASAEKSAERKVESLQIIQMNKGFAKVKIEPDEKK